MEELKYHIDNKPASARDVIRAARDIDEDFAAQEVQRTSVAATILRKNGRTVGNIGEINNE